jgi:hypothetical protein
VPAAHPRNLLRVGRALATPEPTSGVIDGSDRRGERAATVYSLIVTAKLNDVDPRAWHANVLAHCRSPGLQSAPTVALALVAPDRGRSLAA